MPLLNTLVAIKTGKLDVNAGSKDGKYPFFTCAKEPYAIDFYNYDCECVLVAGNGDLNVKYFEGKFNAYQRTYIVQAIDKNILDTRYLFHFLNGYVERLRVGSIGGVIKYIKLGHLTDIDISLPPLPVQRHIAKVLDQADQLRRQAKQMGTELNELAQSLFLEMFGDPVTNPKGWEISTMSKCLASPLRNGLSPSKSGNTEGKVFTLSCITRGKFNPSAYKECFFATSPDENKFAKVNDLLICRGNGNLKLVGCGRFSDTDQTDITFPDTIIAAKVNTEIIDPEYLEAIWNSQRVRQQVESGARTTNGTYKINQTVIESVDFPVPPRDLQAQYAEASRKIVVALDNNHLISADYEQLFHSLTQQAFNGQLKLPEHLREITAQQESHDHEQLCLSERMA